MHNKRFSRTISVSHGIQALEEGLLKAYGAVIEVYRLDMTIPKKLALISTKNRKYRTNQWQVFTPRHKPKETLLGKYADDKPFSSRITDTSSSEPLTAISNVTIV